MTIQQILGVISGIIDQIVPFLVGLGVFVIIWGIFTYITHSAEEEKRTEARQYIVYGIIGIFLMLSVWGLVTILRNTFSLTNETPGRSDMPSLPAIPGVNPVDF